MEIGTDVFVQQGISDHQIEQLISFSRSDSEIKKFTSDYQRFKDLDHFKLWLQQGRVIYTLFDLNTNLLGIIWFSQKTPPVDSKANFNFAIRVYSPARGLKLSLPFIKLAFKDLISSQKQFHIAGFWLETHSDNFTAIRLYQKFGFKQISHLEDKLIMVLSPNLII